MSAAPLRVLMVADVSPAVVVGGAERVLWEQAVGLAARGHDVRVVCRAPAGTPAGTVARDGVAIHHFAVDRRSPRRFLTSSLREARRAVRARLAERAADVVHAHQPLAGFAALGAAGRRVPFLYTFHSPAPLEYGLRHGRGALHRGGVPGFAVAKALALLERRCVRRAAEVHVLSDYSASLVDRLHGVDDGRVVRIPGAADPARFRPVADVVALRTSLGLAPERPVLLTVRNLQPRMGLDALVLAVDHLRRDVPDVLLVVGGDGPLRDELAALVAARGLGEHVRFLGFVPEAALPRWYAAADAVVLPTRELEGFGLVMVEALACGTPVLGTPVGAIPEVLEAIDRSWVFAGVTADALAAGLGRFLGGPWHDGAARDRQRAACRRLVEERYTWDLAVARLEEVLRRLCGRWGEAPPCPVCGAATMRRDFVYRRRPYWRCAVCDAGMIAARPSPTRLRHLYEVEYPEIIGHARIGDARQRMFERMVGRLGAASGGARLLDVGCSGGHLLAAAARRGWRAVGSDLSHDACAVTRAAAGAPVFQADGLRLPVRNGTVDAVTLLDIVDLTVDPLRAVGEAARVLAPGGQLLVRVRNGAFHRPLARLMARSPVIARWLRPPPVLHVFTLPPRSVTVLLERAGFRVVDRRNSALAAEGAFASGGRRWLRGALSAVVSVVERVSRRRALWAPSVEVHARKVGVPTERA